MSIQTNWHQGNIAERIAKRHAEMMKRYPSLEKSLKESQQPRSEALHELMKKEKIETIKKNNRMWKRELNKLYTYDDKYFCWKEGKNQHDYLTYKEQLLITKLIMEEEGRDSLCEMVSERTENKLICLIESCLSPLRIMGENQSDIINSLVLDVIEHYHYKIQTQLDEWFDNDNGPIGGNDER